MEKGKEGGLEQEKAERRDCMEKGGSEGSELGMDGTRLLSKRVCFLTLEAGRRACPLQSCHVEEVDDVVSM
jgi:hypothetical protein